MVRLDFDAIMAQSQGGYVSVEDGVGVAVAMFLAGERASFCVGAGYVVDGGLIASLFLGSAVRAPRRHVR